MSFVLCVKNIILNSLGPLWRVVSCAVPKNQRYIAVNTFPDFDDTVRAIALQLINTDKELIILTTRKTFVIPNWLNDSNFTVAYRYSLMGFWLYHRSKYFLFTHGCFSRWNTSRRQLIINVWHGMPIKNIGLLDGKKSNEIVLFDFTIANDEKFQKIIASSFGVSLNKVLLSGHPRIDILQSRSNCSEFSFMKNKRVGVWLPTYRVSIEGDIREDGDRKFDIFSDNCDLSIIDETLTRNNCICIVKPHPMAEANRDTFRHYKSLMFLDDKDLAKNNITLYELLSMSSFLITDISSVYFDYKFLNRPIFIYCPDLVEYSRSRGFVAPLESLIDDEIITEKDDLAKKLEMVISDENKLSITSNQIQYQSVTKNLFEMVGILK